MTWRVSSEWFKKSGLPDAILRVVFTVNITAESFPCQPAHWRGPHYSIVQGDSGRRKHRNKQKYFQMHSYRVKDIKVESNVSVVRRMTFRLRLRSSRVRTTGAALRLYCVVALYLYCRHISHIPPEAHLTGCDWLKQQLARRCLPSISRTKWTDQI